MKMIRFLPVAAILSLASCNQSRPGTYTSPPGYDLEHPERINLSKKIDEISGMAYSAADNTIYAIDDNTGDLYAIIPAEKPEIKKWKFDKTRDYEDLVLADSMFYILESNGTLFRFPHRFPIEGVTELKSGLSGTNEFETLYYDKAGNQLILFCKECETDKNKGVSAYAFDLATDSFSAVPVLELKKKDLETKLDEKTGRIKASAGTINPLTGEVFIVSSINKLLIVANTDYTIQEVYPLDPELYGQPEGICFSPDGTMYISNEAVEGKPANILVYKRK